MAETDDVGIVHCAITCSDGSSTAVKRDIDRTDLPPPRYAECAYIRYTKHHILSPILEVRNLLFLSKG